mmetsp:Transcript_19367/g.73198  ORF Transcript_19367/g.73198 Transcript_19367/m.73198 type:complete len:266 (+) Transcript_19367:6096-6893(+)
MDGAAARQERGHDSGICSVVRGRQSPAAVGGGEPCQVWQHRAGKGERAQEGLRAPQLPRHSEQLRDTHEWGRLPKRVPRRHRPPRGRRGRDAVHEGLEHAGPCRFPPAAHHRLAEAGAEGSILGGRQLGGGGDAATHSPCGSRHRRHAGHQGKVDGARLALLAGQWLRRSPSGRRRHRIRRLARMVEAGPRRDGPHDLSDGPGASLLPVLRRRHALRGRCASDPSPRAAGGKHLGSRPVLQLHHGLPSAHAAEVAGDASCQGLHH